MYRENVSSPQPSSFEVFQPDGRVATYEPIFGTRRKGIDSQTPAAFEGTSLNDPEAAQVAVVYPIAGWSIATTIASSTCIRPSQTRSAISS